MSLNSIEVKCPKCGSEPGSSCVGRGGKALVSGPHEEREEAARQAPDPDLSERSDPELAMPCPLCMAEVGAGCRSASDKNGPFPVGHYHHGRTERAAKWPLVLRALPSPLSINSLTVAELEAEPTLKGIGLANVLTAMLSTIPAYAKNDGIRPARWCRDFGSNAAFRRMDQFGLGLSLEEGETPVEASETIGAPQETIEGQVGEGLDERKCRVCGCTWDHACPGGCYWVDDPEGGNLCSECAAKTIECAAEEVPPPDPIQRKTTYRSMTCALPDHEIVTRALEIRKFEQLVDQIKNDAKLRIKPLNERIAALKTEIDEGEERRVECEELRDFATNTVRIVRLDTGEQIETRALTVDERQQELPLVELQRAVTADDSPAAPEAPPDPVLEVECPTCTMPPGEPCRDAANNVLDLPHPARVERAAWATASELDSDGEDEDLDEDGLDDAADPDDGDPEDSDAFAAEFSDDSETVGD